MSHSDPRRLRMLAVDALAISAGMTDPACRLMMVDLAASYELLADHAEAYEAAQPSGEPRLSVSPSDVSDGKHRPLHS